MLVTLRLAAKYGLVAVHLPCSRLCLHIASSFGTSFYFAAPKPQYVDFLGFEHQIYIYTASEQASYVIENTEGEQLAAGQATSSTPGRYDIKPLDSVLNTFVISSDFKYRKMGFHVRATGDEAVSVLYTMGESLRFSSYQAYPLITFEGEDSYVYYAVSVVTEAKTGFSSQVLLVSCEDNTEIVIKPTDSITLPADAQKENTPLVTIARRETSHPIMLNKAQTLLFLSKNDLTGSKIVSNKPLTVISGHECGMVEANYCENLAVQVPPVVVWGNQFLLTPLAHRKSGQFYRIVSSADVTSITYKIVGEEAKFVVIPKAGGVFKLQTKKGAFVYLSSNKPVMVVQLAAGNKVDDIGDPIITLVSPTHMYVSSTLFVALESFMFTMQAISVTVEAGDDFDPASILYDGTKLDCEWIAIRDAEDVTKGYGCTYIGVTGGSTHTVSHKNNGRLSVLSYGFGVQSGYGYLAGMHFGKPGPISE